MMKKLKKKINPSPQLLEKQEKRYFEADFFTDAATPDISVSFFLISACAQWAWIIH